MNFEKGNWYKIRNGPNFLNIIKCSKNSYNSTEVNSSQHINLLNIKGNPPSYDRTSGSWGDIYESEKMDVNSEEIQKYLPKNHPNKIPDKTFILPENWYLKITEENVQYICDYVLSLEPTWMNWNRINILSLGYIVDSNSTPNFAATKNINNETMITFEQFKKYVLKEESSIYDDYSYLIKLLKNITK
jgi:hypothetical protein